MDSSEKVSIPDSLTEKLVCTKCGNLLSVFPVYSLHNGENVCGRCVTPNNSEGFRNNLYETVFEFMTYPCMNKRYGCMESRTAKNMVAHEMRCPNRRINCPTFESTNCDWIGELDSLQEHYENNHVIYYMAEPSFELNIIHNFNEICLLPYADSLFLVKKHGDIESKKFWCSIQTVFTNETDKYEYILTLKNPKMDHKIEYPKKLAIGLTGSDGIEIKTDEIQKELHNPSTIVASITILEFTEVIPESPKSRPKKSNDHNMEMLRIIECPICMEFMVPPIFQCSGGHSICGECKSKVKQCPSCEKPFGDTQNYAVESFTSFLKYPCKNLERGCNNVSSAKDIKQHEKLCKFGSYDCPTSDYTYCKWNGMRHTIWEHCKNYHIDNVMEKSLISIPYDEEYMEERDEDYFIVKSCKNIFLLHWLYSESEKMFYWALQLVGPPEESEDYIFDIDVIDRNGRNSRIFMRGICGSLSSKDSAFEIGKSFLFLTYGQVRPLINEVFCYKLSVHENKKIE